MSNNKSSNILLDLYHTLAANILHKTRYIDKLSEQYPHDFSTWPAEFAAKSGNNPYINGLIKDAEDITESPEKLDKLTQKLKDRKSSLTRGYQKPHERKEDVYTGIVVNAVKADIHFIAPDLLTDEKDPVILRQIEEEKKQAQLQREKEEQERRERERQQRLKREQEEEEERQRRDSWNNYNSSRRSSDDDTPSYFSNNFQSDDTSKYDPPANNDFDGFGGGGFGGGGAEGDYRKEESRPKRFDFEKPRF